MNKTSDTPNGCILDKVSTTMREGWERINLLDGVTLQSLRSESDRAHKRLEVLHNHAIIMFVVMMVATISLSIIIFYCTHNKPCFVVSYPVVLLLTVLASVVISKYNKRYYRKQDEQENIIRHYGETIHKYISDIKCLIPNQLNDLGTVGKITSDSVWSTMVSFACEIIRGEKDIHSITIKPVNTEQFGRLSYLLSKYDGYKDHLAAIFEARNKFKLFPDLRIEEVYKAAQLQLIPCQ